MMIGTRFNINYEPPARFSRTISRWEIPEGVVVGREAINLAGIQQELVAHLALQSSLGFLPVLRAGAPPNFDRKFIAAKPGYIKIKTSKGQGFFNGFLTQNHIFQRPNMQGKPSALLETDILNPNYVHQTQLSINTNDLIRQLIKSNGDLELDEYDPQAPGLLSLRFKHDRGHFLFREEGRFVIQIESSVDGLRSSESLSALQSAESLRVASSSTVSFTRPDYVIPDNEIKSLADLLSSRGFNPSDVIDKEFKLSYQETLESDPKPAMVLAKTPRDVAGLKKALLAIRAGQQQGSSIKILEHLDSKAVLKETIELIQDDTHNLKSDVQIDSDSEIEIIINPEENEFDKTIDLENSHDEFMYDCDVIPIEDNLILDVRIDAILAHINEKEIQIKELEAKTASLLEASEEYETILEECKKQKKTIFAEVLQFIGEETLHKIYGLPNIGRIITSDWDGLVLSVPHNLVDKPEFLEIFNAFDKDQVDELKKRANAYLKYLAEELEQNNPDTNLGKVLSGLELKDLEQAVPVERFGIVTPVELVFNMLTNYCYKLSDNLAYGEQPKDQHKWEKIVQESFKLGIFNLEAYHQHLRFQMERPRDFPELAEFIRGAVDAGARDLKAYYEFLPQEPHYKDHLQRVEHWIINNDDNVKKINDELEHLHEVGLSLQNIKVRQYIDEWLRLNLINQAIGIMHHIDYDHNLDRVFEHGYDMNSPYGPELDGAWFLVTNGLPVYGDKQSQLFELLLNNDGAMLKATFMAVSPECIIASRDGEISWCDIVAKQLELGQFVKPETKNAYLEKRIGYYTAKQNLNDEDKSKIMTLYKLCEPEQKDNFPKILKEYIFESKSSLVKRILSFFDKSRPKPLDSTHHHSTSQPLDSSHHHSPPRK